MISSIRNGRLLSTRKISSVMPSDFAYDVDAEDYLVRVETADASSLEYGVRNAISAFIKGCKTDNTWTAIKAACILFGARTLSGALIPLVGAAPTNNNFVSADYSRTTGLLGNKSNKWLNSNRNCNEDPQNDSHIVCYVNTAASVGNVVYMGAGPATNETGATNFGPGSSTMFVRSRTSSNSSISLLSTTSVLGVSRGSGTSYIGRANGVSTTITANSQTPYNGNIGVFAATNGAFPSDPRMLFYSIGTNISLSLLDSRLQTLRTAIVAALS